VSVFKRTLKHHHCIVLYLPRNLQQICLMQCLQIYEGTSQIQRVIVSRELVNRLKQGIVWS